MNYLIHKECGNQVQIDATGLIRLLTSFGITSTRLKVGLGRINTVKECETKFFCLNCDKNVEDVVGICLNCGKYFDLDELWTLTESGGMYCDNCSKIFGESRRSIKNIVSTISLR